MFVFEEELVQDKKRGGWTKDINVMSRKQVGLPLLKIQRFGFDVGGDLLFEGSMNSTPAVIQRAKGNTPHSAANNEGGGQVLRVSQQMHDGDQRRGGSW